MSSEKTVNKLKDAQLYSYSASIVSFVPNLLLSLACIYFGYIQKITQEHPSSENIEEANFLMENIFNSGINYGKDPSNPYVFNGFGNNTQAFFGNMSAEVDSLLLGNRDSFVDSFLFYLGIIALAFSLVSLVYQARSLGKSVKMGNDDEEAILVIDTQNSSSI